MRQTNILLFLTLASFYFVPLLPLGGISLKAELILIIIYRHIFYYQVGFRIGYYKKYVIPLIITTSISVLLSILLGFTEPYVKDTQIVFQVILYGLFIEAWNTIFVNIRYKFLTRCIVGMTLVIALIGISQRSNLLGMNEIIDNLYSFKRSFYRFEIGKSYSYVPRSPGLVDDPRHFGFILVFGFIVFLSRFRLNFLNLSFVFIVLTAILFTGSKNALIATVLSIILWGLNEGIRYLGALLLLAISFIAFMAYSPTLSQSRALSIESYSGHTIEARVRDNTEFFHRVRESPVVLFFGMGPAKKYLRGSEHSGIGWWLIRFGLIGLLIFLRFLSNLMLANARKANLFRSQSSFLFISLPLVVAQYILSESLFKNPILFETIILMSMVLSSLRKPYVQQ